MNMRTLLLASVLVGVALAGCATNDDADANNTTPTATDPTPTPDATPDATPTPTETTATPEPTPEAPTPVGEAPSFTLTATNVPEEVIVNEPFEFTLTIEGDATMESDHIGAHYNTTPNPEPAGAYGKGCEHQSGSAPGEFTVRCTFADAGEHYLRGHLRVNASGTLHNFWTDEFTIAARAPIGDFTLTTSNVPAVPVARGESFNFTLTIDGADADFSDHIGGHFGTNTTDEPSVAQYPLACAHVAGDVPGVYEVTCTVPEDAATGTYYLRGHMRITAAGAPHNFWAAEDAIIVV